MARLFHDRPVSAEPQPLDPLLPPGPDADDDLALGWECANPALQLEGWEPVRPAGAEGLH